MKNDILHKEKVSINQSAKQWVISIVLLINVVFYSLLFYFYIKRIIPNDDFRLDDMISVSVVIFIISIISLFVIFLNGYTITVNQEKVILKYNKFSTVLLNQDMIKSFKRINKKEYFELLKTSDIDIFSNKKGKKKKKIESFLIGSPNFVIFLNDDKKVFIQTNKIASFEYAMNKLLNIKYV